MEKRINLESKKNRSIFSVRKEIVQRRTMLQELLNDVPSVHTSSRFEKRKSTEITEESDTTEITDSSCRKKSRREEKS
jgi:hypothetical protein